MRLSGLLREGGAASQDRPGEELDAREMEGRPRARKHRKSLQARNSFGITENHQYQTLCWLRFS